MGPAGLHWLASELRGTQAHLPLLGLVSVGFFLLLETRVILHCGPTQALNVCAQAAAPSCQAGLGCILQARQLEILQGAPRARIPMELWLASGPLFRRPCLQGYTCASVSLFAFQVSFLGLGSHPLSSTFPPWSCIFQHLFFFVIIAIAS